ncbi:MAG: hypothetical protein JXX29_11225 [Deltaproteobacteria bacterium]|nr:hypothetical protein [Deltaproteobacteria bacterium]MBN2672242.1 hypothetical protein [Deltaproteobacteria bacterium]
MVLNKGGTCGITSSGTAFCWGDNSYGQSSAPIGTHFISVTARTDYSCGIREDDGTEMCWGKIARNLTD